MIIGLNKCALNPILDCIMTCRPDIGSARLHTSLYSLTNRRTSFNWFIRGYLPMIISRINNFYMWRL